VSKQRAKKKSRQRARAGGQAGAVDPAFEEDARRVGTDSEQVRARRERMADRDVMRTSAGRPAGPDTGGRREPPPRPPPRYEVRDGIARPQPIWHPIPLTEIGILAGMVIFLVGYFASADRSPTLIALGAILLAIVVGEMCLREHFAGFRSHSILLALLPVTVIHTFIAYAITPDWYGPIVFGADILAAVGLAWWLQLRFKEARRRAKSRR
jgi:hypothetical protein